MIHITVLFEVNEGHGSKGFPGDGYLAKEGAHGR